MRISPKSVQYSFKVNEIHLAWGRHEMEDETEAATDKAKT